MPGSWWTGWEVELPAVAMLLGVTLLYLRGAGLRRRRFPAAEATPERPPRGPRRTATVRFLAGVAALLVAFVGPVPAWSVALLWAHMTQHLLIVAVGVPLIAWSGPGPTIRVALPRRFRRRLAAGMRRVFALTRRCGNPHPLLPATTAFVLALWAWHLPPVYDAAAGSPVLHLLEHASFLGTALWFWGAVVTTGRREAGRHALATLCLAALIVQGGLLGALISFADAPLYTTYQGVPGLPAEHDQQLAGALMWVPPGVLYAIVAIRHFVAWLRLSERELQRREANQGLVNGR